MFAYFVRRLALLVPTLVGMSILTFSLVLLVPGDPAAVMLGERATPEAIAALPQSDQRTLRDILARAVENLREA